MESLRDLNSQKESTLRRRSLDIFLLTYGFLQGHHHVVALDIVLCLIDDYSRKVWTCVLKSKDQSFEKFKEWKVTVENQTDKRVKHLRTDNGLEFLWGSFNQFCINSGITRHRTIPYTPRQNGVAEQMNRTITERVGYMLFEANSYTFWVEAVAAPTYTINRSPCTTIDLKTPKEMWSGKTPDLSNLKVFGCVAYVHTKQGKLELRALKCMVLGYPKGTKGYKLWDFNSNKSIVSRDVIFFRERVLYVKEFGDNRRKKI